MNFIAEDISRYCEAFSKPPHAVLGELERETHLKALYPQMLSGHLQGKFLNLLSSLVKPKRALEIGTYTGYSAICIAMGLAPNGKLHTIEANEELEDLIRKYFKKSGLENTIELHIGKAEEVIPGIKGNFDLVFIDAEKCDYPAYYEMIIDRVNPGGIIIADNALWSGKVLDEDRDIEAAGIHEYNELVTNDPRVDNVLLPLRDGLMIARKIS